MKVILIALAFLTVVVVLHQSGFSSPMVFDSRIISTTRLHVFETRDLWQVLTLVPGRPLFMLSLYLNYIAGDMNPVYFRLINAAWLAVAGTVLMLLIVVVLDRPDSTTCSMKLQNRVVAAFLGLLFVTHPLQVHTVLYIWQRQALMACLFHFSAVLTYIMACSGRTRHPLLAYAITGALFLGGILSKESVVSLPAVLVAAELTLFRRTFREMVPRIGLIVLICLPALFASVAVNEITSGTDSFEGHRGVVSRLLFLYKSSGLSFFEVLLTECRVLFSYLGMILAPVPDALPLVYAETISRTLWEPRTTIAACIGVVALVGAGFGLVRKRPVAAFGIFFYVLTFLPEAFLVPLFLFFSYRAVLPMAGVALVLADVVSWLLERAENRAARVAIAACLVAPALYFGFVTLEKAQRWNPLEICRDDYALLPELSPNVEKVSYGILLTHYGLALAEAGDVDASEEVFQRAKEIAPNDDFVNLGLGHTRFKQGNYDEAAKHFLKITEVKPRQSDPYYWLGMTRARQGRLPEAMGYYRKSIEFWNGNDRAYFGLAEILAGQGNDSEAITHYQRAIECKPNFVEAYISFGSLMLRSGRADKAGELFEKAVALRPDRAEAHAGLGSALLLASQPRRAAEHLRRALEINPGLADARKDLTRAMEELKKPDAHSPRDR